MIRYNMKRVLLVSFLIILFFSLTAVSNDKYDHVRLTMVKNDISGRGIKDKDVLAAFKKVPRHLFVDKHLWDSAYNDHPLPIVEGQTISQPYVVALMTELLHLKKTDKVLEIGTGSGYQAAILAEIVSEVYSMEIRGKLAERSKKLLKELKYQNIQVKHDDGYFGWEEHAPFDAIIITAAANHIPPPLIKQLKNGGKLILPLGSTTYYRVLTLAVKEDGKVSLEQYGAVTFVPMTGKALK